MCKCYKGKFSLVFLQEKHITEIRVREKQFRMLSINETMNVDVLDHFRKRKISMV